MLKSVICSNIAMNNDMGKDKVEVLWRRIVIAANTLSTQLIIDKKYPQAIEMLETTAALLDTVAQYYLMLPSQSLYSQTAQPFQ